MNTTAETQIAVPDSLRSVPPGAAPRTVITRVGERILRAELERLRCELGAGMAERLREARAFGAPAANDEYLQLRAPSSTSRIWRAADSRSTSSSDVMRPHERKETRCSRT